MLFILISLGFVCGKKKIITDVSAKHINCLLYTSTDFRERIQINNRMISKDMLTEAVEKTFPIIEELRNDGVIITEFEYVNALQFYIHANEKCDIVV